jgi:transposase
VDRTLPAGARHDLTDAQWTILAPLLPVGRKPGRRPRWTKRQLIDGIRFRTRTGCPWRDVPERYGTWQSVYGLFRRWQLTGTWAAILSGLQALGAEAGLIDWTVSVDSTIVRAHSHAAGVRRHPQAQVSPPTGEPANHALGRSRGGFSTKVHLAVETRRKPLAAVLTPGQAADSPQFVPVLTRIRVPRRRGRPRTRPTRVLADKAYSARANRAYLRRRGIKATIPVKADQQRHRRKKGSAGAGRRHSTGACTGCGTRSSAGSAGSSSTAGSPPAMTSWPSATRRPCRSPASTSGSATYETRPSRPSQPNLNHCRVDRALITSMVVRCRPWTKPRRPFP